MSTRYCIMHHCVCLALSLGVQAHLSCPSPPLPTHTILHNPSGADLTICATNDRQCCLQSYIDAAMAVANNKLNQELRFRLRDTSSAFNNTVNLIYNCKLIAPS